MEGRNDTPAAAPLSYAPDERSLLPELRKERLPAVEKEALPALRPVRSLMPSLSADEIADRATAALVSAAIVAGIFLGSHDGGVRIAWTKAFAFGQRMDGAVTLMTRDFGDAVGLVGDAYLASVSAAGSGFVTGTKGLVSAAAGTASVLAASYTEGLSRAGDMLASVPTAAASLGGKTSVAAVAAASGTQGALAAVLEPVAVSVYKAIHPVIEALAHMGKR